MEKMGIEQMKLVMDFLIEAGEIVEKISQSSNMVKKISHVLAISDEAMGLLKLDLKKLGAEYKDLDESEKKELLEYCKEELDLEDDVLEERIEGGFQVLLSLADSLEEIMAYVGSLKKKEK